MEREHVQVNVSSAVLVDRQLRFVSVGVLLIALAAGVPAWGQRMAERAPMASASAASASQMPEARQVPVVFKRGSDTAVVNNKVRGFESVDHRLTVKAGQRLTLDLKATNSSTYFNLLPPASAPEAIFIGSRDGSHYSAVLPEAGEYTVRVYQMRNAARRGDARYTLTIQRR